MRSVALSTEQPCGMDGRLKRTSARLFEPLFDMTLRIESEPLLLVVLPESIHASALAVSVCWLPQFTVGAGGWTVHVALATVWSRLPAASTARTRNVCVVVVRFVYAFGEVHAA